MTEFDSTALPSADSTITPLQRFRVGAYGAMVPDDKGGYVRYEDAKLMAHRAAQQFAAVSEGLAQLAALAAVEPR